MPEPTANEFGKRRPAALPTAAPVKRSKHVALLLMGTMAVGGGAFALMPRERCESNQPGMVVEPPTQHPDCARGGSSAGGGHGGSGGSWSRSSLFGGDQAASRSPSAAVADGGSGSVTRGGFGSFARAFAGHFSFGG